MTFCKKRTGLVLAAMIGMTFNSGCMMAVRAVAQQRQPADPGRIFDSADSNGDGIITREEFVAAGERAFARLDRNSDGYIDHGDMSGRLAARQNARDRLADLVAQLDKDGDGRISRAEFMDARTVWFDRADTDHNRVLSREEAAAAKRKLAVRHGS
jgi:EF-hand domain pair